jgi:hypothetical protein
MQLSKPPKPKATRKTLKKEILSDDFKKRKIFWKILRKISGKCCGKFLENIAENFWKILHLTSLTPGHLVILRLKGKDKSSSSPGS